MADRDAQLDPGELKSLLLNYARALRKDHRRSEARSIEARVAALQSNGLTDPVVDVSELLAKPKRPRK